ncbi:hypothetical protein PQQ86_15985 [Paraburkholderia sediminicola]|uniref:tetratricopeptide repeat protein n=1 Tax=Paraburkholderia sediminicola TaxID=458836 RepID=UPI0038B77124
MFEGKCFPPPNDLPTRSTPICKHCHSKPVLFALAAALQAVGEYAAAIETYRSLLAFEPGHVDALNNAATLMRTLGRIAGAESHLREALTLEPHHCITHNNLGRQALPRGNDDAR